MLPKYPIYIVSKGRWDSRLTSRALEGMGVPYFIVIEQEEYEQYSSVIDPSKILILDKKYQDDYEVFDGLGDTKSKGPGAARNFAWDHSIKNGHARHWVMDDNLDAFHRLNRNIKSECDTPTIFRLAEMFVERYQNVPLAGFNYYSCLLIDNECPMRWRGRYNEDTDLSLRILKAGFCTIQFNAFLQGKVTTQRMKGGNTEEFYRSEGTKAKSEYIANLHPDVAKVVWKFGRWHHHVDYKPFKRNRLIKKFGLEISPENNEFGMVLVDNATPKY